MGLRAAQAGVASIVDRKPNRQTVVDVERPCDRSFDSIRRPTPAVVRASDNGIRLSIFSDGADSDMRSTVKGVGQKPIIVRAFCGHQTRVY